MTESRRLLQHFLAALAYRTQKALRDAPLDFADFNAGSDVRTPHELILHMTDLIGYARSMLGRDRPRPERLPTFTDEVERFHAMLGQLLHDFANDSLTAKITDQQFLQGPLADAMTHAGQIAMLRRLHGVPVAPENFAFAKIDTENVSSKQAAPTAPDPNWTPNRGRVATDPSGQTKS